MEVPCSGVPLGSLAGFWDGCRLWEINSVVWKSKRIEEISGFHNFHHCWRQRLIPLLVQFLMFLVVPSLYLSMSRQQGGCLSSSLLLNMILIWNKIVDGLLMWLFVTCDVNDVECLLFSVLMIFGLCLPTHSKDEPDWTCIGILEVFAELLGMKCGPLCSSIFEYVPFSTVSVGIRIPSSASTPQVGFMWSTTSPIQERSKS